MCISHLLFSNSPSLGILCICKAFSFDAINYGNLRMKISSRKSWCFLDISDYGLIFPLLSPTALLWSLQLSCRVLWCDKWHQPSNSSPAESFSTCLGYLSWLFPQLSMEASTWRWGPGSATGLQSRLEPRSQWGEHHGLTGLDGQESMTACEEFQMEQDALSAGVGVKGLTQVSIPAGSQIHTPYHNYSKLSHASALPLPLLQGQGKPTTLPGHQHGSGEVWEEAQPGSASPRPAMQLAVSCHPLLTPFAFCLLKGAVCFHSNQPAELCWDSCCKTPNKWKWEGIHEHHERNGPLAPGWKLKQDMAAAVG